MGVDHAWVDIVRAAYRLDIDDDRWLDGIVDVVRSRIDHGLGVYAHYYRAPSPDQFAAGPIRFYGCSDEIVSFAHRVIAEATPEIIRMVHLSHPFGTTSDVLGREVLEAQLVDSAPPHGVVDSIGLNAVDPIGNGCIISAPLPQISRIPKSRRALWTRVTAHFAAGHRLRCGLGAVPSLDTADAVLDARGRVKHATGRAASTRARETLVQAVAKIQQAHGKRIEPLAALDLWTALVDGTWSIVDRIDTDGKAFYVAWRNDPGVPLHRTLSSRELQIASYAALGHSNKLIAYSLGIGASTVATHLTSAQAKLGVRGRVALIELVRALRWSTPSVEVRRHEVGALELAAVGVGTTRGLLEALSGAEHAIAQCVLRGMSDKEIARERGTSPRTVANQLRRIYERFGVRSRAELAAALR